MITRLFLASLFVGHVVSSAIPIWELLTHQEKVGNLTFIFLQLVHEYCKQSQIPDCEKVLTLYGMSNLLKEDEDALDRLDPYSRGSRSALWRRVMSGAFDVPVRTDASRSKAFLPFPTDHQSIYHKAEQREIERDFNKISDADVGESFHSQLLDYDVDYPSEPHPHAVRVPPPPHFINGVHAGQQRESGARAEQQKNRAQSSPLKATAPLKTDDIYERTNSNGQINSKKDSPIISIVSRGKSLQHQSGSRPSFGRDSGLARASASSTDARDDRQRRMTKHASPKETAAAPSSMYIIPSDPSREAVLLRILKR